MPASPSSRDSGPAATYRPNVAAIVKDADGRILVGERSDCAGAWQFPQGGIARNETAEEALKRELAEELSLRPIDYLVAESHGPFRYLFEEGRTKEGYNGQEQRYFLVELVAPKSRIDVATEHREFQAVRWIRPGEFQLDWLPPSKRPVYAAVLNAFFGLTFAGFPTPDGTPS